MVKAIMLDDYEDATAAAVFGPFKGETTRLRKNGTSPEPGDVKTEEGAPEDSDASGVDSEGAELALPLDPPLTCSKCGKPVEECEGDGECLGF